LSRDCGDDESLTWLECGLSQPAVVALESAPSNERRECHFVCCSNVLGCGSTRPRVEHPRLGSGYFDLLRPPRGGLSEASTRRIPSLIKPCQAPPSPAKQFLGKKIIFSQSLPFNTVTVSDVNDSVDI